MLQLNILGNLGRDAEVKTINDKQYLSFSVASTEKQGEQEQTTWVSVLCSHNPNLLPFLKKGQQVFVSGKLKAGIYQNQNSFGIDLSVFASTLQLCGGKREESQQTQQPASVQPSAQTPPSSSLGGFGTYAAENNTPFPPAVDENGNQKTDDDLPF